MRPAHLGFAALALLAGTAGYVMHQEVGRTVPLAALAPITAPAAAPATEVFDWSFADVAGQPQALAQWRGRLLVLNFWATWCPPCLHEIPAFIALQQRLGGKDLQFVGIALDQVESVRPFVADHGMNYPVLVGDQDVARFMTSLGNEVGGLPYTVIIGRDGKVLAKHQGEWAADAAANALEGYLASP